MLEAETLGLDKLYLFTPDRRDFYGSLGWQVYEHTAYRGVGVVIMQFQVRGSYRRQQGETALCDNFDG
jgi:hypothetical protein